MVQTGECSGSSVCFLPFSLLLLLTRSCLFIAIRAPTNNNLLVNLNHGGFRKWVTKCVSCCLSQEQIDSCIQLWVLFYLLGYAGTFLFISSSHTSWLLLRPPASSTGSNLRWCTLTDPSCLWFAYTPGILWLHTSIRFSLLEHLTPAWPW